MSWRKSTPHNNNHRYVYEFEIIIKNYYHVAGVSSSPLSINLKFIKTVRKPFKTSPSTLSLPPHKCNNVWHHFYTSEKDFEPWQVWILIQQNKGMRTEVLNFPTVPVFLSKAAKYNENIRMVGSKKYPCTHSCVYGECSWAREDFLFVSFFPCHFCFFNLHLYILSIDRIVYDFLFLLPIPFGFASCTWRPVHTLIFQCGPEKDPWENFFVPWKHDRA